MAGTFLGRRTLCWQPAVLDMLHKFEKKVFPAFSLACKQQLIIASAVGKLDEQNKGLFLPLTTCATNLWNHQLVLLSPILEEAEKNYSILMQKNNLSLFYLLQKIVRVIKNPWEENLSTELIIFSH